MTTRRWEQIFDELAEATPAAQTARLAEIAATDPELARFLGELLAADRTEESPFGSPLLARAPVFVASALEAGVAEREGEAEPAADEVVVLPADDAETIGPYRLVRTLGEGGMGEVFLAERSDGEFEQRVAIKRIRAGLESQAIAERFLRERQILARLDHPGIAHLLDGGSTEEGDPYFVLEHVEGVPITHWCERRGAPLEERVRLMGEVADAVDAAHRQLVVHRDLKPTNILVTANGRVKLLDFGIAKVLQAEEFDERQTQIGGQPLTPAYAAPEQILGEAVTTATDVYSMGALLFELLTGRPPFDRSGRPLPALVRAVDSETLERPSVVAADADESEPEREIVRAFAPRLEGDLDAIVLKALHRDPARRYPSAAAFRDDLRRFLAGRPVKARPDSPGYRLRKFVGRHSLGVAAGIVACAAAIVGIVAVVWQAGVARGEARRADRVKSFLIELFREADPSQTMGETITAREILEKGAARLEEQLVDEPAVRAELLDAIAQVERSLGLLDPARKHADAAVALRRREDGRLPRDLAAGLVTRAEVHFDAGELEPAGKALDEALTLAPGLDSVRTPLGRRWLAARLAVLGQQLDMPHAETLWRKTLAEIEADPAADPLEVAHWRLGFAGSLADASRVSEAEPLVRQSLAALEDGKGKNPVRLATSRLEAAELLEMLGDRSEAERWLLSGLDLERATLGRDHPDVALWEVKLGFLMSERRRYDEAEAALRHAVSVLRPLGHYDAGSALRYLGFVAMGREQYDAAYALFVEAETVFRETVGEDSPLSHATHISQGWALLKARRFPEAKATLERALAEVAEAHGAETLQTRSILKYLGEAERELGRPSVALEAHRRALEIEQRVFGKEENLAMSASRYQIGLDLQALGGAANRDEAAVEFAAAIAMVRRLEPASPRLDDFLFASGRLAQERGDLAAARRDLLETVERYREHDGSAHARTVAAERALAVLDRPAPPAPASRTARGPSLR